MFFKHITNFVAARESGNDKKLVPSTYLDIERNKESPDWNAEADP